MARSERDPYPRLRHELPAEPGPPCPHCGQPTRLERLLVQRPGEPVRERLLARCSTHQEKLKRHTRIWKKAAGLVPPVALCPPLLLSEEVREDLSSFIPPGKETAMPRAPRACSRCGGEFVPRRANQTLCEPCRQKKRGRPPAARPAPPPPPLELPPAPAALPPPAPAPTPSGPARLPLVELLGALVTLEEAELEALVTLARLEKRRQKAG